MCFILFANRFLNKVLNGIKTFYPVREQVSQRCYCFLFCWKTFNSVENLVEKPVGEQDKTHEFSLNQTVRKLTQYLVEHNVPIGNWTKEIGEHTLPKGNVPGTWRNTLCQLGNAPGHGRTHSADWKSTRDVAEHTLTTGNQPGTWRNTLYRPEIDRDVAERTPTFGNWPGTQQNTLWRPEIDPGCGGTHSANRKSTQNVVDHTLMTGNRPGT